MAWQTRESRYLYQSRWYNLRQDEITLPSGEEITYTLVEHPGYAMVVPLLADGRVVMERVYRHSVGRTLLECPSGGLDGEPADVAARRELEEETGYLAPNVEPLGSYFGSSGISDERFHLFLARDVGPGGTRALEPTEQIEVELFDLDELVELARRGELTDGPSALAILLTHARQSGGGRDPR
jgi:ADP-ribose pyrophosphatase